MTFRRSIVALVLAVLLFAALSGQANASQWWGIFTPILLLVGLVSLREELASYVLHQPATPRLTLRCPRGPPLS